MYSVIWGMPHHITLWGFYHLFLQYKFTCEVLQKGLCDCDINVHALTLYCHCFGTYTFLLVGIMSRHLTGVSNIIFSFENIWINYFSIPFSSEAFYINISSLLTCIFQFFFPFLLYSASPRDSSQSKTIRFTLGQKKNSRLAFLPLM